MSTAPQLDKTIDIRHYVSIVWRRKWIILLCLVTTLCATVIAMTFMPSEYESTVTITMEESRALSRDLEALMGGVMQTATHRGINEERLAKLAGRVRSRPFLERVIRLLNMHNDPLIRERAAALAAEYPNVDTEEMAIRLLVKNLESRIRFGSAGTGIYRIIVADYSAQNAQILAQWISQIFADISSQETLERIQEARDFGTEQLRIYEERLRRSEQRLEAYRQSMIEQSLTQSAVRGENLVQAEALLRKIEDEVALAEKRIDPYLRSLVNQGISIQQVPMFQDAQIRTLARNLTTSMRNEVLDRLAGQTPATTDWPPVEYGTQRRDLLRQIERATSRQYPEAGPDLVSALTRYTFSRLDWEAQQETANMLSSAIAAFRQRIESSPGGEIQLTRLENEVENNRRLLQSFEAQMVASDLSTAVNMMKLGLNIEILDPAQVPLEPSRPNRPKILMASLALGGLLGLGFAFVGETLDPVLRSLDDFKRVAPEPILGTTPLMGQLISHRSWLRRHWVWLVLVLVLGLTGAFFLIRSNILRDIAVKGVPIQIEQPAGMYNENP